MSRFKGLYPVPGNMFRAAPSGPRPCYGTMSFAEPETTPDEVVLEAALAVNDLASVKLNKDKKIRKSGGELNGKTPIPLPPNVAEKSKKKKKESLGAAAKDELTTKTPAPEKSGGALVATSEDAEEQKPGKKNKKSLNATVEDEVFEVASSPVLTTAAATSRAEKEKSSKKTKDRDGPEAQKSEKKAAKKRKRASEVHNETSSAPDDVVLGGEYFQDLEDAIGREVADFDSPQASFASTEVPAKKKVKTKRKNGESVVTAPQEEHVIADQVEPTMEIISADSVSAKKERKEKKERKRKRRESLQVPEDIILTSATVQGDAPEPGPIITSTMPKAGLTFIKEPRNTPIPLPPNSSLAAASAAASPLQRRTQMMHDESEVLVVETPPSKRPVSSLSQITTASTGQARSKKGPTVTASATKQVNGSQLSAPAPAVFAKSKTTPAKLNGQASLTESNLERYTQPLSDQAKPRPHSGRSSSVSSASSMSIKDAFARVPKSSSTPGASKTPNPFSTPIAQQKAENKDQKAGIKLFNSTLTAFQASVNMANEQVYLSQHLELRAAINAAGPLPCLKSATGCTPKTEQHLRAQKKSNSKTPPMLDEHHEHQLASETSIASALEAEKFLHNAVVTGIPMPTGALEGTYTLYCPAYTAVHADKYAFGARQLTISQSPGSPNSNTYTARLHTPPRPMSFAVLSFTIPPNASFRPVPLTTSADAYPLALVVLGNGYILLRADIGLLLTGKRTAPDGMEFVGVRDGAAHWAGVDSITSARQKDALRTRERAEKVARAKDDGEREWIARKAEFARMKMTLSAGRAEMMAKVKGAHTRAQDQAGTTAMFNMSAKPRAPAAPVVQGAETSPKKRGRPTNAEIVRRAVEAQAQAQAQGKI